MAKSGLHPVYGKVLFQCVCGNALETRSTLGTQKGAKMQIDICSACHPFYTGKHKLIDTAGRVKRFEEKYRTKPQKKQKETAQQSDKT